MRFRGSAIVGMIGCIGLLLAGIPRASADTAAYYEPPPADVAAPSRAKLVADRQFGFAPMTVTLAGMLESSAGALLPIDNDLDVVLVVESPFIHLSNSSGSRYIGTDFHYESTTSGPADQAVFIRAIELRRPGRYVFRIQVVDRAGQVLESNEVTIKAM